MPATSLSVSINGHDQFITSRSSPTLLRNLKIKLLVHIGLVLAVSTQVLISSHHSSVYNLAVTDHWRSVLARTRLSGTTAMPTDSHSFLITSESEVVALIRAFAQTYFKLNTSSLNFYSYLFDESGAIAPIELKAIGDATFCDRFGIIRSNSTQIMNSSDENLLLSCVRSASSMTLYLRYLGFRFTREHRFCALCRVQLSFVFGRDNQARIHSHCRRTKCNADPSPSSNEITFTHISLFDIILSAGIFVLGIMSMVPSVLALKYPARRTAMRFVFLTGDACGILASLINVFINNDLVEGAISRSNLRFLFGICALICCVRLMRYVHLVFGSDSTALVRILLNSLPEMAKIIAGCAPIMIGLVLIGMVLFANHSSRFSSFGMALQSIFAMVNGDYVQDAFHDTGNEYSLLSKLYIFLVITLTTWTLLNIILARIQCAFFDEVPPQDFLSCRSRMHFERKRQLSPATKNRYGTVESDSTNYTKSTTNEARFRRVLYIIEFVRKTVICMTDEWTDFQSKSSEMTPHVSTCNDLSCSFCISLHRLKVSIKTYFMSVKESSKRIQHSKENSNFAVSHTEPETRPNPKRKASETI